MNERPAIPESELDAQRAYMQMILELPIKPETYHIVTYGCQMNARDSETIAGMLEEMGMRAAPSREDADIVVFNTCCVRENAENKALGNVIWLKELKKVKPGLLICVGGCMTQESGMAERIRVQYPFVDVVFGTHNMHKFPAYLYERITSQAPVVEVLKTDGFVVEGLPERRLNKHSAFVNIMYGCNNFCSYCIVPYVRGRERSREPEAILFEAKRLLDDGVKEITLLGQNVNSYRGGGAEFAELLYRLDRLGIERIRFMTSHPKDLSEELIAAYGELPHLMPALHLPVQSGSDEILSRMNRNYDRAHYLDIVRRLRAVRPEIGLTTDIIVGFPGETEEQFLNTMALCEQVRFDAAFTFIYSPRKGTRAADFEDGTPYEVKSARIQRLIARIQQISLEILRAQVGKTETVLVDSVSSRDEGSVAGKTPRGHMVNFPGKPELIGQFQSVEIVSAGRNTLRGRN